MNKYIYIAFLLSTGVVFAQTTNYAYNCNGTLSNVPCKNSLPPAGKNAIYRCGNLYSNVPCIGAKEIDTTKTRGFDTWTGEKLIAHEHLKNDTDKVVHEAWRRLHQDLGGTPTNETYEESKRRSDLTYQQRIKCMRLKEQFKKPMTERQLYELRLKYKNC